MNLPPKYFVNTEFVRMALSKESMLLFLRISVGVVALPGELGFDSETGDAGEARDALDLPGCRDLNIHVHAWIASTYKPDDGSRMLKAA